MMKIFDILIQKIDDSINAILDRRGLKKAKQCYIYFDPNSDLEVLTKGSYDIILESSWRTGNWDYFDFLKKNKEYCYELIYLNYCYMSENNIIIHKFFINFKKDFEKSFNGVVLIRILC